VHLCAGNGGRLDRSLANSDRECGLDRRETAHVAQRARHTNFRQSEAPFGPGRLLARGGAGPRAAERRAVSPDTYRSTMLRAAEDGNWAEIERLTARYGWSLLRDVVRCAWETLLVRPPRRRADRWQER
jgi:hypothetical protein